MSPFVLRAEQVMWLTLLELMGGASAGALTNAIPLISGMSPTSNKLEFQSSKCLALTSSFASVDPVVTNLVMGFSPVGITDVPMEVVHWKNPKFQV